MQLHDQRHDAPIRDRKPELLLGQMPASMRRALRWRLMFVGLAFATVLLLALLSEANAAGATLRF